MAYTKQTARHDKITIDGVDVSNAFRQFGFTAEHSEEDVSGFSATGQDEFLPGRTDASFSGEAFYTEELAALLFPLFRDKEAVRISWQPDGLNDATREIYYNDNCTIFQFGPANTRGTVSVMPFSARPDVDGIQVTDFT